jgi:hypothetical protein
VAAVIAELPPSMKPLVEMLTEGDSAGIETAAKLAKLSEGNFRRLQQFGCYISELKRPIEMSAASIERIWCESFLLDSSVAA